MNKYFLYYEKKIFFFFLKSLKFKTHFLVMPYTLSLELGFT